MVICRTLMEVKLFTTTMFSRVLLYDLNGPQKPPPLVEIFNGTYRQSVPCSHSHFCHSLLVMDIRTVRSLRRSIDRSVSQMVQVI